MTPLQTLQQRFDRVAQRYGQVIGAPPLKTCDPAQLQSDIRTMVDTLNGRTDPQAGPATKVGAVDVSISITADRTASALVMAELHDAAGRRAGSKVIPLNPVSVDATVKTLLDAAAEIANLPKDAPPDA